MTISNAMAEHLARNAQENNAMRTVEWRDESLGLLYASVDGRDEFLIRKCFLINNHTQGETGRHPRWDILARDESYMGGGIHPAHILRCRSLAKAKRAVMKEIASPGHCARVREIANNRREWRRGAGA